MAGAVPVDALTASFLARAAEWEEPFAVAQTDDLGGGAPVACSAGVSVSPVLAADVARLVRSSSDEPQDRFVELVGQLRDGRWFALLADYRDHCCF